MFSFRTIIERLSRGKVIKRHIQVGSNSVPILVSPDAQLKYLKLGNQAFDRDLIDLAIKHIKPGDVVWDIGANVGVFTFAASTLSKTGAVLSVEADSWLTDIIRRTAQFDEYSQSSISVLSAAIANENSVATFLIAQRGRASNALQSAKGRSQMGGARQSIVVPTLTLDRLLDTFLAPDFVKIDIEGAELMALEGASKLISDSRPKFYIEVGQDVAEQVYLIFKSANYQCLDPASMKPITHCLENTLFVPNDDS